MVKRTDIPDKIAVELMLINAHSCCICKDLNETAVQIHHIDGNKNNHILSNLAVLCQKHHGFVEAKFTQTRNFTIEEIKKNKESWEMFIARKNNFEGIHFLPYKAKEILSKFSRDFAENNYDKVEPLDYRQWHEKEADWKTGSGELISFTHKEIHSLWNDFNRYSIYESSLLNFVSNGGTVKRTFTIGAELQSPKTFSKIVFRHFLLGFETKIMKLDTLNFIKSKLNIEFDTIGALNHNFGYYYQLQDDVPLFARTTNKKLVNSIYEENKLLEENGNSIQFSTWQKKCPDVFKLNSKDKQEVESICETIIAMSKSV
jgi:hypothetical protein